MNDSSLQIMLRALRLPSMLANYRKLAGTATANNWSFEQDLGALVEVETADRAELRRKRLLKQSRLPEGKTLDTLNQALLPPKVRRIIPTLLDGGFVERAAEPPRYLIIRYELLERSCIGPNNGVPLVSSK